MNQRLALNILGSIMNWDDDRATNEFLWLRLMSRLKYDGYSDFLAGARFLERLIDWLQQFEPSEREAAYQFVRNQLVYIGPAEMQRLVTLLYADHVLPQLRRAVARELALPWWKVSADKAGTESLGRLRRATLFMGLSEGARLDTFRRANRRWLSNEQVVLVTQVDDDKWADLLKKLRENLGDSGARFSTVWLIDDFTGSGTTLLRNEGTADSPNWKGKLDKFWRSIQSRRDSAFTGSFEVFVHHYIATDVAVWNAQTRFDEARQQRGSDWYPRIEPSFGMVLPSALGVSKEHHPDFWALTDKYYDSSLESEHTVKGGTDMRRGFSGAGLPLILDHNTPNNSVSLLWATADGAKGRPMRPLFHRRQRHE